MRGWQALIRCRVAAPVLAVWLGLAMSMTATPVPAQVGTAPAAVTPGSNPAVSTPETAPGVAPEAPAAQPVPTPIDALAEAEKALTIRPILPPADPVAAAAYSVLETHCARCHQGGRLKRPAPAAGLGNILRLDELADMPHLVRPGNPEASPLYLAMLRRLMPFDTHRDAKLGAIPTAAEVGTVRTWINSLKPRPQCRDRRFVSAQDHAAALTEAAKKAGDGASHMRFISIAHLHNGCERFVALAAYRQAIVKLVNSLSWKPKAVPVTAIDDARTLYQVDLRELGWLPEHWERIMRAGNQPIGLGVPLAPDLLKPFGTQIPVARADWLTATVLKAPLYYDVLGLPGTGPEILKILQIDSDRLRQGGQVLRMAASPSAVSLLPTLIERTPSRIGGLWTSYHAMARDGAIDPAPYASKPATEPVPHHASRTMFTLPNGLPAFFIVGQRGDRLDALPPDIAQPVNASHGGIRAGLDCFSCHGSGLVRSPGLVTGTQGNAAAISAIDDAMKAAREAFRRNGLVPNGSLDGVEPLFALALHYTRPLSAERVAAELGVNLSALETLADRDQSPAAVLARRLVQGVVSRTEIEARGSELTRALREDATSPKASSDQASTAEKLPIVPVDDTPGPAIVLYSDKARYKQGDLLQLTVRTASDCHLTLISIDQRDRATVIYPSDFEANTLVTAEQSVRLPGAGAPYAFRLRERGHERIVALCNEAAATTDGITHDFERQRFTDLGIYSDYVSSKGYALPKANDDDEAKRGEAASKGRRRGRKESVDGVAKPEQITRTAITIAID